jgi:hypothetical protein
MGNLNRTLFIATFALIGLTSPPRVYADSSYQTGFEYPPFVTGQLVDQDGWIGVNSIPKTTCEVSCLSPGAAVVSKDLPFAGLQSVQVRGVKLVHQDFIHQLTKGYYDAIGSYRKPVNYVGISSALIQAVVFIDGPLFPSGNNFFSASVAARALGVKNSDGSSTTVGIGELAISSDGKVYGYSGDDNVPGCPSEPCVPSFLISAPITLGAWHTLAINVNFQTRTFSFSVDGNLLQGSPFPFPTNNATVNANNTLTRGSLVVYAAPDTQAHHKSSYGAYFDNFSITAH